MPSYASELPSQEILHKLFEYRPETGELIYKERTPDLFPTKRMRTIFNRESVGRVAGRKDEDGYVKINVFWKLRPAHRIIWKMSHGECPVDMQVDHIDGNPSNNKIENLRLVTNEQNAQNVRKRSGLTSKGMGVYKSGRDGVWCARITYNKKSYWLGTFDSEKSAIKARKLAEQKFGFHENHGRLDKTGIT